MNRMKEYLRKVGVGALVVIAGIMGCITLLFCALSLNSLLCWGYAAIILYCLIPRSWSYVGISLSIIAASFYIIVMFLLMLYQPGRMLLSSLLPIMAVLALLKGKPKWMWGIVALIFLIIGVYLLFNNDIIGPMTFRICDRPIDIPAQWGHNYRLFWSFALLQMVAHLAGILSIMVMAGYSLYKKTVRKP